MPDLKIMTWFWRQNPEREGYGPEMVNRWAAMFREYLTIPHQLAVVTDHPDGIDAGVEIIPLSTVVPRDLLFMKGPGWEEKKGLPQCYRRLSLFMPDAAERFGAEWLVSTDLDCIVFANLDSLFDFNIDFRMFKGTSGKRPYNGSMIQLRAGSRPQVYQNITPEGIAESRRKYVGSDQAWISHVLGWHEQTWTAKHGVHAWSTAFRLRNMGPQGFLLPGDTRLLFFPAPPKPWGLAKSYPRLFSVWAGQEKGVADMFQAPRHKATPGRLRLWAYNDPKGWGKAFQIEAKSAGHRGWLFDRADAVVDGEVAFVRLDQQGAQRDISRNIGLRLGERGITTLPTMQETRWYDDKLAQYEALNRWLPETWISATREDAEERLEYINALIDGFPFISKAAEGSGSYNVRLIKNIDEAWAEIVTAFASGIPLKYGRIQQGYVYWQRLVAENPVDYRVVIVGEHSYGLVRKNKPGTVFASGSGINYPITLKDEREIMAMKLGREIADEIKTQWLAFDFVFDGGQPKVLELSSAWTMASYKTCQCFDRNLKPTAYKGADSFKLAVDIMVAAARAKLKKVA
jgi:glutathione synthase/RimK-type ligase-like ATP-grasp enzyme